MVGILVGSESDLPALEGLTGLLTQFGLPHELLVCSAHRAPEATAEYAETAAGRGVQVLICAAGRAAHLPGTVAARTTLPVIGLPIASGPLQGMDALFSIVQMPGGVPVATVGINAAKNAAILAAQIVALHDDAVRERLTAYRASLGADAPKRIAGTTDTGTAGGTGA